MRRIIFIILLLSGISAYSQETLTYEMAIATALDNNYGIKIAKNNKQIAENNQSYGNAGFMPTLTANFDRTYGVSSFEQTRVSRDSTFLFSNSGVRNQRQTYGVTANWTIFDGMQMFHSYDQLSEINAQSDQQLRSEVELVIFNVSIAFYQTALEKERLELSENNIELSEERLRIAKEKYELGKASKMEYLQAQVDLNSDITAKIRQAETLNIRKLDLLRFMAVPGDSISFTLSYTLDNNRNLVLDDLINTMELTNPQLLALRRAQAVAIYDTEINRGQRLPQVDLFASFTHSDSESPAGFAIESQSDDLTYGLTASWQLFDGFNVNRRIQNAKIQAENTQYALEQQLIQLTTEIRSRYINYQNNLNLMQLESENVEVAKENNDIAQERYQIGLSNPLELREAQINLINAELRLKNAAFAAKLAEIELKYLSGQMATQ